MKASDRMPEPLDIIDVEIIRGCGIVVTFSDSTTASYPSEELAALRPFRKDVATEGPG
jgi:hypothetical protein